MNYPDVPQGFGFALMQNEKATNAYAMMTREQKNAVLAKAHAARTEQEMRSLVASLANDTLK